MTQTNIEILPDEDAYEAVQRFLLENKVLYPKEIIWQEYDDGFVYIDYH